MESMQNFTHYCAFYGISHSEISLGYLSSKYVSVYCKKWSKNLAYLPYTFSVLEGK